MIDEIVRKVRHRDERALARTITLVEQRAPERIPLLKALYPYTGRAEVIGITGTAGSGKSTLAGQLIRSYREQYKSVAVIAVDPTSPYSGGAALGDRIRIQRHDLKSDVFIRSMASRGQLGGLAPTTADVATVLDAAGWDRILVETVGIGQNQLDVSSIAHVVLLLLVPGMGDDIQMSKAGVLEAADIYVINKSDRDAADDLERALRECSSLNKRPDGWTPPIIRTVANTGSGVQNVTEAVDAYYEYLRDGNLLHRRAIDKCHARLLRMMQERLAEGLLNSDFVQLFNSYATAVAEHRVDPYTVIEHLLGTGVPQEAYPAEPATRRRA